MDSRDTPTQSTEGNDDKKGTSAPQPGPGHQSGCQPGSSQNERVYKVPGCRRLPNTGIPRVLPRLKTFDEFSDILEDAECEAPWTRTDSETQTGPAQELDNTAKILAVVDPSEVSPSTITIKRKYYLKRDVATQSDSNFLQGPLETCEVVDARTSEIVEPVQLPADSDQVQSEPADAAQSASHYFQSSLPPLINRRNLFHIYGNGASLIGCGTGFGVQDQSYEMPAGHDAHEDEESSQILRTASQIQETNERIHNAFKERKTPLPGTNQNGSEETYAVSVNFAPESRDPLPSASTGPTDSQTPQGTLPRKSTRSRSQSLTGIRSASSSYKCLQSAVGRLCILDEQQDTEEEVTEVNIAAMFSDLEFFREQGQRPNFELTCEMGVDDTGNESKPFFHLIRTNFEEIEAEDEAEASAEAEAIATQETPPALEKSPQAGSFSGTFKGPSPTPEETENGESKGPSPTPEEPENGGSKGPSSTYPKEPGEGGPSSDQDGSEGGASGASLAI